MAHSALQSNAPAREVEVKGLSFKNALDGLAELRGPDAIARVAERVSPELREMIVNHGFLPTAWYPIALYKPFLRAILDVLGGGPAAARELAKKNTQRDLRGIYRLLVFFLSPEDIIRKSPVLYGRYRRGGKLTIPDVSDRHAVILFEGCHGFDAACWQEMIGGAEAALEAAGAKNLVTRILDGGGDGDAQLRAEGRWSR